MNNKKLHIVGGGILSMDDLEKMNQEEVKNRKYTHCTIDSGDYGKYLAKVAYSEISKAWEPTEVLLNDNWISIEEWDDMDGYNNYGCSNYICSVNDV